MRLLICACVVATHVVANANSPENPASNATVNLLHYTRQAFFFISALVLVHVHWGEVGADGKVTSRRGQMRRRISVLGIPYVVWSTIYMVLGLATAYSLWALKKWPWQWFAGLIQGTDGYHMYFLLVSVEFAIVFPLFLKLLYATRRHHVALLVVSGTIELAMMAYFHYIYQPDGWWRAIAGESSLTAYQFWLVAGGVAAVHLKDFHAWLLANTRLVVGTMVGICAAATAVFFVETGFGEDPQFAGQSLQPITVPLSLAAIGAFYLLSNWIAGVDRPWARRTVLTGTYYSFGIYLSHPAILTGLLILQKHLPGGMNYHPVTVTLLMLVLDFGLSVLLSWLFSLTPWSKALIGRPRRRKGEAPKLQDVPAERVRPVPAENAVLAEPATAQAVP